MNQTSMNSPVKIAYFSDVLCVWAYIAQIRIDELKNKHGGKIQLEYHFLPLFADTATRIGQGWKDKDSYQGFGRHVLEVGQSFPHESIHPKVWTDCTPKTSSQAHLFLKAIQVLQKQENISPDDNLLETMIWQVRCAFFRDASDIGEKNTLLQLAEANGLPVGDIERTFNDGSALAALFHDIELRDRHKVEGSPTYLLNEGRQKLYGNIGYRIIEANVMELLERPEGCASWC